MLVNEKPSSVLLEGVSFPVLPLYSADTDSSQAAPPMLLAKTDVSPPTQLLGSTVILRIWSPDQPVDGGTL